MELSLDNVAYACEKYAALQHPVEVFCLLRFLEGKGIRLVVELGVHRGGMLAVLASFLPDPELRLIGVEILPLGTPHPVIESRPLGEYASTLEQVVDEFGLTIVEGNSQDQDTLDRTLAAAAIQGDERGIDLLFIDAAHDYDSVKRDFELWSPHAKLVGFHDLHAEDIQAFLARDRPARQDIRRLERSRRAGHRITVLNGA